MLFAEIFTQIWARHHTAEAKNEAARLPGLPCHCAMIVRGDQSVSPYTLVAALAEMTPKTAMIC
jgi:hypothetical protein